MTSKHVKQTAARRPELRPETGAAGGPSRIGDGALRSQHSNMADDWGIPFRGRQIDFVASRLLRLYGFVYLDRPAFRRGHVFLISFVHGRPCCRSLPDLDRPPGFLRGFGRLLRSVGCDETEEHDRRNCRCRRLVRHRDPPGSAKAALARCSTQHRAATVRERFTFLYCCRDSSLVTRAASSSMARCWATCVERIS